MKVLRDDNRGATLIGVVVSLIVVFISVMIGIRYKNYIQKESIENKIEYRFFNEVHNITQEIYSYDWAIDRSKLENMDRNFKVLVENDGKIQTGQVIEEDDILKLELKITYEDQAFDERSLEEEYILEKSHAK